MASWGSDPRRLALAVFASREFRRVNGYPNPFFIPEDPFRLIAWDHASVNVDHGFLDGAIEIIQSHSGTSLSDAEWAALIPQPYGTVIDALLSAPIARGA